MIKHKKKMERCHSVQRMRGDTQRYNRVEWFTVLIFKIVWTWTIDADQVYFYKFDSKKSAILQWAASKFSFSKITGTLKFANTFFLHQLELAKKKKGKITFYFRPPKWVKWYFWLGLRKNQFLFVSLNFLLLNKLRNTF